ncbi:MAG: hypothetical protein NTZ26_09745 [Candidatus Aminicenantes bacterium]|nr:hypothetical protein [Candidatus Aminicenantes bacterium]
MANEAPIPDYPRLVRAVLDGYTLPPWGAHGLSHWARVWEIGLRLAETTGADPTIVRLFAIFHDSKRLNENQDPRHGARGALFAASLRGPGLDLADQDFVRLSIACEYHTHRKFHPDPTIQTCWDADRLDLPRVGKRVNPDFIGTAAAKQPDIIAWAARRGIEDFVPALIKTDWGVDFGQTHADK